MERDYLDVFRRNIDSVLDIGWPSVALAGMVKGARDPGEFFELFRGHDSMGSHRETGRYHVSILDDHDMVGRAKQRFAAANTIAERYAQVAHAVGTQLTTLGVPCIYYGTEQAFDGSEARHDSAIEPGPISFEDRYIRESMFGASFGAFETSGCHFFDPSHPTYQAIAAIAAVRNRTDGIGLALRRGRQYRRETSFFGRAYAYPGSGELVAWSRILYDCEVVVALNTHGTEARGAEVTVDASLHPAGSSMKFLYPAGGTVAVNGSGGRSSVRIDLPPAGMAILA